MMHNIFRFLAFAAGIYSLLIFIRIILSWFRTIASGKLVEILYSITDPYLNFFRRNFNIQIGVLDFSAIVAIVSLSLIQRIFFMLSMPELLSLGRVLAVILISVWSIVSFIIGFFIVIIVLRMIAYLTSRNIYSPFWNMVDSISQPIMYRMNRLFFGKRIGNYLKGIILSLLMLVAILIGGRFIVNILISYLSSLQI